MKASLSDQLNLSQLAQPLTIFSRCQDWYPGLTAGVVTVIYLLIHWLSPSLITLVSIIGLVITLLDYLVPMISDMVLPR